MTHHRYNGKFQSHGFQVAIGTLTMCAFFDEFFKMDLSTLDVDACVAAWPSLEAEQRRALDLFRDFPVPELGYTEITKKWNDAETVRVQLTRVKENWPAFKARLQAQCYPFEKMRALFAARVRRPILRRSVFRASSCAAWSILRSCCAGASICSIWPNAHGFTMNWSPASSARAELGKSHNRRAL